MRKLIPLFFLLLAGCSSKSASTPQDLASIQILDRNGFSETVSAKDRLNTYEYTDFLAPQPYKKVVRVYGKASLGKTSSKITTYHPNGQPWQYLEIENGRAHGNYFEWHTNGQLKIEAIVIEGTPDVGETAQLTWLFDETSIVYDEEGNTIAQIPYKKGVLEGMSREFYSNGQISKEVPYDKDEIDGIVKLYGKDGDLVEEIAYDRGLKDGKSFGRWSSSQLKYEEFYRRGALVKGDYFDPTGKKISSIEKGIGQQAYFDKNHLTSLVEFQDGKPEGKIENYDEEGHLISLFYINDGMKNGDEWEYYPTTGSPPKLYLQWNNDTIQGVAKTWYPNGILESQREMHDNKKHGLSFAWFQEGDLMLMEEYEDDQLVKGSYFKKWEKTPISKVENGKGMATLFDKEGRFLKKIIYEKGLPQPE